MPSRPTTSPTTRPTTSPSRNRSGRLRTSPALPALVWAGIDTVLILAFAVSGRRTHEHGVTFLGVLDTAWPFLTAYALASLALRAWRSPSTPWPTAVALWLATVVGGLLLRAASGEGVAVSFQIVTLLVLGTFLVLPRAVLHAVRRRRLPVA